MKTLVTLSIFFSLVFNLNAATCYSLGNGDWENPLNWSCGAVPNSGDTVIISLGDTVNISFLNSYAGSPMTIIIDGYLLFDSPGAKLHLPCGSTIILNATGAIGSSGVGAPSHDIKICGQTVWDGTMGKLLGPLVIIDPTPLGSTLISFTAEFRTFSTLMVNWLVENESNMTHYRVDYSENGERWAMLAQQVANNYSEEQEYNTAMDVVSAANEIYVRLTAVDADGTEHVQKTVLVRRESLSLEVYPNPCVQGKNMTIRLTNEISANQEVNFEILTSDGKLIQSGSIGTASYGPNIILPTMELGKGLYLLSVDTGGSRISERFIIQ